MLVQRRTDAKNAMWQKERLLNVALGYLPKHCTKVRRKLSISIANDTRPYHTSFCSVVLSRHPVSSVT